MRTTHLCLLLLTLTGCGATQTTIAAQRPDPAVTAHWRIDSDVAVEVDGVGDEPECSVRPELDTICVRGLQSSLRVGLESVLAPFMRVSSRGSGTYLARLHVGDFTHDRAAASTTDPSRTQTSRLTERPDLAVGLVYTFELFDQTGRAVVSLQTTTIGPRAITSMSEDGERAILELQNEVLEEIANAVDVARLDRRGEAAQAGREASTGTTTVAPTPSAEPPVAPAQPAPPAPVPAAQ